MLKTTSKILLCDEDVSLATVVADFLRTKGYDVDRESDGQETLNSLCQTHYDLCLLSLDLRTKSGIEVLEEIRQMGSTLPIIVLTNSTNMEVILSAYEQGCDDYMTKPLSIELLVYKMEALLRRSRNYWENKPKTFDLDGLFFDGIEQKLDGQHLPSRESDLLLLLCQNKDELVDKHLILRSLWNNDDVFASRSLRVYINHLRKLLVQTSVHIQSVRGKGYKLNY